MAKTGKQVQGDIYRLLRDSTLYTQVTGEVYRNGTRPRDSQKEDIVVIFTTGLADEIQEGIVTVNIFCPDIDPYENGVWVEDGQRTEELERLAAAWVDSLSAEVSCYLFDLQQAIYTEEEADINQHFVVVKLHYRYYADGDDYAPIVVPQAAIIDAADEGRNKGYMPLLQTEDGVALEIQPVIKKVN